MVNRNPYPLGSSKFTSQEPKEERRSSSAYGRSLEDGLAMALKKRQDTVRTCGECGASDLEYKGLGVYKCRACKQITKTTYAIVRDFIEEQGCSTMLEIINGTGLEKKEVEALINSGSLVVQNGFVGVGRNI